MNEHTGFVRAIHEPPELAPFKVSSTAGTFYLTGLAEVRETCDTLHFMAQTYSDVDDQRYGVSYYLSKRELEQSQDPGRILKYVLENLFKEIDEGYHDRG